MPRTITCTDGFCAARPDASRRERSSRRRARGRPRGDVEVRVHRVDVVVVLQRVDQPHQLRRAVLVERDERLGPLGDLGVLDLDAGLVERGAHARPASRRLGDHLEDVVVHRDVLGAGVDRDIRSSSV